MDPEKVYMEQRLHHIGTALIEVYDMITNLQNYQADMDIVFDDTNPKELAMKQAGAALVAIKNVMDTNRKRITKVSSRAAR